MTCRRLVCRNIADGTGAELFSGRITINNHFITAVERGDFAAESASDTFYDEDVIVCPAFILLRIGIQNFPLIIDNVVDSNKAKINIFKAPYSVKFL